MTNVCSAKVRFTQVGSTNVGIVEISFDKVDFNEVGLIEISVAEIGSYEIGLTKVGSAKVRLDITVLFSPFIPSIKPHPSLLDFILGKSTAIGRLTIFQAVEKIEVVYPHCAQFVLRHFM
jgi:hypothetical protein